MSEFEGKVTLITGGGGSIGRATALLFAQAGADIAVVDLDGDRARQVAAEIEALGRRALAIQADVAQSEACAHMISMTMQQFGRLNVLFNNAGIGGVNLPLTQLSEEDWDRLISINLRGVFLGCKYGLPAIIQSGGGAIINMASSMAGWDTAYGGGAYMASKEGVAGLTKNLALEAAAYGVRVNAVCPGIIETDLSFGQSGQDEAARQKFFRRFEQRIPLRRVGQPDDVAGPVLFLASTAARHITGATLLIDGGQTLQSWANAPEGEYPQY
jgi:NAD(P)-dependent dehydrogenase (short-subunit alcohol dehydrogenase family)